MNNYSVMHTVYASTATKVVADSVEQAIEIASRNVHCSVCHQCSDDVEIGGIGDAVEVINLDTSECFSINESGEVGTP